MLFTLKHIKVWKIHRVSLVAKMVKNLPAMRETQVWSLSWEDPLEKGMVTCSSILARRIPWTEKTGWLQSIKLQRVGHNWATNTVTSLFRESTIPWFSISIRYEEILPERFFVVVKYLIFYKGKRSFSIWKALNKCHSKISLLWLTQYKRVFFHIKAFFGTLFYREEHSEMISSIKTFLGISLTEIIKSAL